MRFAPLLTLFLAVACGGGSSPAALDAAVPRLVEGSNSTSAILPLADGSTVVSGRAPSGVARFAAPDGSVTPMELVGESFLICYDANGELRWHETYDEYTRWLDMKEAPDGSIIALGETQRDVDIGSYTIRVSAFTTMYFLARIQPSGTVDWAKLIVDTSTAGGNGRLGVGPDGAVSVLVRNGSYTLITDHAGSEVGSGEGLLLRYDASGALQWLRFFDALSELNVAVLANGDTVGTIRDAIFRFDAAGNPASAPDITGRLDVWDMAACGTGYVMAAAHDDGVTFGTRTLSGEGFALLRCNADGSVAWASEFPSGTGFGGLACSPDGQVLAAGGVESEPEPQDAVMVHYDSTGRLLQRIRLRGTAWSYLSEAWFLPGGGIGMSGEANGPATIDVPGGSLRIDADDVLFSLTLR